MYTALHLNSEIPRFKRRDVIEIQYPISTRDCHMQLCVGEHSDSSEIEERIGKGSQSKLLLANLYVLLVP